MYNVYANVCSLMQVRIPHMLNFAVYTISGVITSEFENENQSNQNYRTHCYLRSQIQEQLSVKGGGGCHNLSPPT